MPVFVVHTAFLARRARADLVRDLTDAAVSIGIPAEKVQVFIDDISEREAVTVHIVEHPRLEDLVAAIREIDAVRGPIMVLGYQPDRTARGGVLRERQPAPGSATPVEP